MFEKIILVTRKTRLEELIERFNTKAQAKFYIEHAGGTFSEYEYDHDSYRAALDQVCSAVPRDIKFHSVERALVPSLLITEKDLIVTLGQDGVVANTAKYVGEQPIVGVNPDPSRFDGMLLPFTTQQVGAVLQALLHGKCRTRAVTLGEVTLGDGQKLLAFNDFFIGAATHISARYKIHFADAEESHSSSGIIVSTGAGSTGWLSSVFNMAGGLARAFGGTAPKSLTLSWEDRRLIFSVREPFRSKHSADSIVAGVLEENMELVVESMMPSGGVIFSDGMERDFLNFGVGARATVRAARAQARLVIPEGA